MSVLSSVGVESVETHKLCMIEMNSFSFIIIIIFITFHIYDRCSKTL